MKKTTGITLSEDTADLNVRVRRDEFGKITSGFVLGNVEKQNQAIIAYMHPGELKEYPTLGVGIADMLLGNDSLLFKHRLREQLEADGFVVNYLEIKQDSKGSTNIELNAKY